MQLGFELCLNQTFKLALTPELQQSINILQYSAHELIDFLHQQSNENPILEIIPASKTPSHERINSSRLDNRKYNTKGNAFNNNHDYNPINNYSTNTHTLENHLLEQLTMLKDLSTNRRKILTFLIGNLNEYGFLDIDTEEVAPVFSVPTDEIDGMIQVLQSLDPIGVGAKDLTDCLLIQLREHKQDKELAYRIVENNLTDLAEKRYKKMAVLYGVPIQKVQEAADFIRTLNPRPVSHFSNELIHYIVPDVFVEKTKDSYLITVNDTLMPKLSINPYYMKIPVTNSSERAKVYVKENFNHAQLLIKGLEQRKSTLYKVTAAILEEQQEFFQKGISGLKPMTLKYISEKLNLHESTISRTTSNKYIQTPHGLFKLKSFFTRGLNRVNSQETESATIIKEKIKVLIADEDKIKPFSDQKLCQIFETTGTKISRRTIAKYREDLGIPGSSKRRRY